MKENLKVNFIVITMLAVIFISSAMFGLIIIENYKTIDAQAEFFINLIAENKGVMPEYRSSENKKNMYITKETQFSTRYFTVEIDENEEIIQSNTKSIAMVTSEDVKNILKKVNYKKKESGYYDNFKYKVIENENNKLIIFLDCSSQLYNFRITTEKSIYIVVFAWTIVLIVVIKLSNIILNPIIQNTERQKQFITNASHELKTPLAVIIADLDVLEMTMNDENNEWIKSIKNQINRLNTLIKSLLNLSNIEEGKKQIEKKNFLLQRL